ncbi:MAG TPA: hypothetical protein PKB02_02555 [Anaerohalosphaeraceae bacterium]|nr:hypothetical protein [Anaerohalosphaeraceae bacterium]
MLWKYIKGLFLWPKKEKFLKDRINALGGTLYEVRTENHNLRYEIEKLKKLIFEKQVIYVNRPIVTVFAGPQCFKKADGFTPLPHCSKHIQVDCVKKEMKRHVVTIDIDVGLVGNWIIADIYFDELNELLKQHFRDSGH